MQKDKIISTIATEVNNIQKTPLNKEIFKSDQLVVGNEFLLILKPEIFLGNNENQIKDVLNIVLDKLIFFGLQINSVRIQNASYLRKYNVIAQHYGVINAAARDLKKYITNEAIQNFRINYGIGVVESQVYGALELLRTGLLNHSTLNDLWKDCEIKRLGGGIYCGKVKHNNTDLYIINGFHPPQLEHFITENRLITTINISGNCDWKIARKEMIGNTYPEKATSETIRGILYKNYVDFGFNNVSYVINSVHLSAGPLEGLIELRRFNSAFEKNKKAAISEFSFGKLLLKNFSQKECEFILTNPTVQHNGKLISLYDLTEEVDCEKAIELIRNCTFV